MPSPVWARIGAVSHRAWMAHTLSHLVVRIGSAHVGRLWPIRDELFGIRGRLASLGLRVTRGIALLRLAETHAGECSERTAAGCWQRDRACSTSRECRQGVHLPECTSDLHKRRFGAIPWARRAARGSAKCGVPPFQMWSLSRGAVSGEQGRRPERWVLTREQSTPG